MDDAWAPLRVERAAEVFDGAPFRRWICGGRALELHLGRSWRDHHDDIDVGILRQDAPALFAWLAGWELAMASSGQLLPWGGRPLVAEHAENNVWGRRAGAGAWEIDVLANAGDATEWRSRRDERIRRPWDEAVLHTADGLPYLAPELQLLFKSRDRRPKDDLDAEHVVPGLDAERRAALAELLPPDHPWQQVLLLAASG